MPEHPVRKGSQGPGRQGEAHHIEGLQPGPLLGPVLSCLPGLLLASGQGAVWVPEVLQRDCPGSHSRVTYLGSK